MFVKFEELKSVIKKALLNAGLSEEQAEICSEVHAQSSRDGVESHGLNRVPRFIDYVNKGWVDLNSKMELVNAKGFMEHYDGGLGIGIVNAKKASKRAVELAKEHGLGLVTLSNTTHWMRGGTYAWDTVEDGFIGINWTNTESSMPVWGSKKPTIGNNPICIAVPYKDRPFVLDMAISQYSYGKLEVTRLAGKELPYPGGFDKDGNLTSVPGDIEESLRILPIGYWKGSGFAIALDLMASILSKGRTAADMDREGKGSCTGCSQVFIAIDPYVFSTKEETEKIAEGLINQVKNAERIDPNKEITYPGEGVLARREKALAKGVHVDDSVWEEVKKL